MTMKTALVCIAKNEDNYIEEWINYHIKLGFENIFIYENNWRCQIEHPQVIKIPFDGEVKQVPAYNHFLQNYKQSFDWVGFIDVDEFLNLSEDKHVNNFFKRFNHMNGIGVNWFLFGDNHLERVENNDYSVIKRFTKRQKSSNQHIKTFINLKQSKNVTMGVHNCNLPVSNQDFQLFTGPFCKNCSDKYAKLNHYFTKTKEEFLEKINRGRADTSIKRNLSEFEGHNVNEVEDLNILNFMYNDNNNLLNT